jgi:ferredoxin-NADP reductase
MQKVVVLQTEPLSPSVVGLQLATADRAPFDFTPGQWLNVHVAAGGVVEKRSYSIASAPNREQPERFDLAVTRVEGGKVSAVLHATTVGSEIEVDGPFGFFTRADHADEDALLVATGTGIAPMRAMLQAELARPHGPRLTLLFGCRTEADILYVAELERLAAQHARFRFEPTLSRGSDQWCGRRGYVQVHLPELVERAGRPHVYVCGLSNMVNDVRGLLKSTFGYDRKRIHTERYD